MEGKKLDLKIGWKRKVEMDNNKITYLEMIQGIINRMAGNSFSLKGWAVTLVAGIFALASKNTDKMYFLVTYVPILVFWFLDAYYLLQERLYRSLYNKVRIMKEEDVDFDMNTNLPDIKSEKNVYYICLFSKTELGFYLPLALMVAVIIILTNL